MNLSQSKRILMYQHGITDEEILYWESLPEVTRGQLYSAAVSETRRSVQAETHLGKLGQRGTYGKGASLAEAITEAFSKSPGEIARRADERQRQKEARENEIFECPRCGGKEPEKNMVLFQSTPVACLPCVKKESPELYRRLTS